MHTAAQRKMKVVADMHAADPAHSKLRAYTVHDSINPPRARPKSHGITLNIVLIKDGLLIRSIGSPYPIFAKVQSLLGTANEADNVP